MTPFNVLKPWIAAFRLGLESPRCMRPEIWRRRGDEPRFQNLFVLCGRAEGVPMSSGDILTKRDVAELLQVSERTVERWMSEGATPYVPLPRRGAW